jgi:hypothetical protein
MTTRHIALAAVALVALAGVAGGQTAARDQLARGRAAWDQRLSKSAIAALEAATRDRSTAAEAHEALGRIYTFKGWQQDNVFPGWHDEPAYRARAIAELKAALAADPNRTSAQEALRTAEGFAAAGRAEPAPPRPEIKQLDERVAAFDTTPHADVDQFMAAVDARLQAQADAAPYFAAAQIANKHGQYDAAVDLANRGVAANERFVDENLSAYQMEGKAQGVRARARAQAADIIGWALFQKHDYPAASAKLEEAERLSRGLDVSSQLHIAEMATTLQDQERAREHYLNVLALSGGFGGAPQPVRDRAKQALQAIYSGPEPFDAWLEKQLAAKGEQRKTAALKSLVDKKLPALKLTTIDGKPFSTASLQGKVLLLNFFASW